MTDRTTIDAINKRLHRDYRVLDGRPIYRIVWSGDQLEVRKGTFTDWYGSILIRQEYQAVREIKKYWYLQKPCWILEKLVFIQGVRDLEEISKELVQIRNGSYETIYVFQDKNFNPLPVAWKVVDFIIFRLHNPVKNLVRKEIDQRAEQIDEAEETAYFREQVDEKARSELFTFENAVSVSSRQVEFKRSRKMEYVEKTGPIDLVSRDLI